MIFVKLGETLYPASIEGRLKNPAWDDRDTKAITLEMTYEKAMETFVDGLDWSIVVETETAREEFGNGEYDMAGDVTDHRDGMVTVVMGKPTDLETALELLLEGGSVNV